ncbi:MAG: tryptophan synthase subunit alpha [Gemmatales bacterium]|nr:tryptophan synthase subunit alpha [Gemmatales bacterium]
MRTWTRLSPDHPLEQRFAALRSQGRPALVAFVPAGDPQLSATGELLDLLIQSGVDVIEVGFPYSDPIADGPLIQAAYTRALSRGIRVHEILELASSWLSARRQSPPNSSPTFSKEPGLVPGDRQTPGLSSALTLPVRPIAAPKAMPGLSFRADVPLMAMVSYSIVYRQGEGHFAERCAAAGFSGMIVPDLPAEEAASLAAICRQHDLALVQLVAPTTPWHRVQTIVAQCSGFVYCVSVTGITGMRERLPEELRQRLETLRSITDLPVCVGFGISRPEHARILKPFADGIIVGSALVARLAEADRRPWEEIKASLAELIRELRQALDAGGAAAETSAAPAQQTASQ